MPTKTIAEISGQWSRVWRALQREMPPICSHGSNDIDKHEYLYVEPEWADVFDWFDDLESINKAIVAGGEGSGKSQHSAIFAKLRAEFDRLHYGPDLIWIIGADYDDAFRELDLIHDIEEMLDNVAPGGWHHPKEGKDRSWVITRTGIRYETLSAKDPTKIGRLEPDGIILSEASRLTSEVWDRAYGRLARTEHSWLFSTGSFETSIGPFAAQYGTGRGPNTNRMRSISLHAGSNTHVYPGGRDDPRLMERKANMSPARYSERFEGRPAPPRGIVVPTFRRDLHVNEFLEYDPEIPVWLFVDPGTLCYCVLFVQLVGQEVQVIEEIYANALSPEEIVRTAQRMEGWKYVQRSGHVIDFAARASTGGEKSPWQAWHKLTGISMNMLERQMKVDDKAERILTLCQIDPTTGRPALQVHPRCTGLIAECGAGESPLSDLGLGIWMRSMHHDGSVGAILSKNDHACSALAYGTTHHFGTLRPQPQAETYKPMQYSVGEVGRNGRAYRTVRY